jgi:two-component system sensor histidine kinase KdpD
MQEIVNIYRAFSYMDEPKWERVDFNSLVSHLCELFRLTLSRRIDIRVDLADGLDPVLCEPRLIQLALFNLLTNANQAIKRLGENEAGTIRVTTHRIDRDRVELTVHDSGPGIRGADGSLLEGEALYQVFFLGITTRREGEEKGEGLGLNWVWSIIRDMHAGEVEPANHAEGGAVFHLRLPFGGPPDVSVTEEPAQEPQETSNV